MLKVHIADEYQHAITSLDGNPKHFTPEMEDVIVSQLDAIPCKNDTFDIVNMSLAFQDT
jgi:hypothetical protein